jgi:hypothetical protein
MMLGARELYTIPNLLRTSHPQTNRNATLNIRLIQFLSVRVRHIYVNEYDKLQSK